MKRHILLTFIAAAIASGCGSSHVERAAPITRVGLYGETSLPHDMRFRGTVVGGISGVDLAPDGTWYLLSDDRSASSPARFYTASLTLADGGIIVALTGVTTLLDADGRPYARGAIDPESIRYDRRTESLWITSEGDETRMLDPFIREIRTDGTHVREIPLPRIFRMDSSSEHGPRNNTVFEAMSMGVDGETIVVGTEGVLKQDGPAVTDREGGDVRISLFDRESGRLVRQVAYTPERAPAPVADTIGTDNGVVEIIARDATHLLVLERGYTPFAGAVVRLYEADIALATDISAIDALAHASYRPAAKRLLADFRTLGLSTIDNFEALSWGPALATGQRTLVVAADNNFSAAQVQQIVVLVVE